MLSNRQPSWPHVVVGPFLVQRMLFGCWLLACCVSNSQIVGQDQAADKLKARLIAVDSIFCLEANLQEFLSDDADRVEVEAWPVSVDPDTFPAIIGKCWLADKSAYFRPKYPFRAGKEYRFRLTIGERKLKEFVLSLPQRQSAPTKIVGVFPSAAVVPENNLRFYIQFSFPMQKGDIYQHLQLKKSDGTQVELPFLEIEQEFWSRDSTRLTLLLDPGRIKRGLKPREEMGPILESGNEYLLTISHQWLDAKGHELVGKTRFPFKAGPTDDQQPDPKAWKIDVPNAQSLEPLWIRFRQPLDHGMLQNAIVVKNNAGETIQGTVKIEDHEKAWRFRPSKPWQAGKHLIQVNANLEDSCGNSIEKQFDVDVFQQTDANHRSDRTIELPFLIR